ncbi:MAG: hypothetical protein SYR96_12770 [Actinomycetota bacterium]|nr:hypothetical protein [Actinomycetota bacterium]
MTWGDVKGLPVLAANQLAVQVDSLDTEPDLVVLTVGHVVPPIISGAEEQRLAQVEQIKEVVVQPLARFSVSPGRLREWVDLLRTTADRIEEMQREEDAGLE